MKYLLAVVTCAMLCGCVTQATLIAQDGPRYKLDVNPVGKKLHTVIDGVEYNGSFVKDQSVGFGFGQTYGSNPAFGTGTTFASGNNGQAVMTSANGGYIQCAFSASGMTVVGNCQSNTGRQFVLTTE